METYRGEYCPRCGAMMDRVLTFEKNSHSEGEIYKQTHEIEVILDNVRSVYNVGSIFRTADGAGVKHIYLCGITPNPQDHPAILKTALGAECEIAWSYHLNALSLARELVQQGYHLLALECTVESIPLQAYSTKSLSGKPTALIIGNERTGVDPGLIELCQAVLALPMAGKKTSLNVAVAFGIAAYWLSFT